MDSQGGLWIQKIRIHLLGGGFCNDLFLTASTIFSFLLSVQETATIIATGASFFPLSQESRHLLSKVKFDYISVRDRYTAEMLQTICPIRGDDLLGVMKDTSVPCSGKKKLYINIQNQFDAVDRIAEIALRVKELASTFSLAIIICELCPGDLDVVEYLDGYYWQVINRSDFLAGTVPIESGSYFIGTRFHFRMLMEKNGLTGIAVIVNHYYENKHEIHGGYNFRAGHTRVVPIDVFISESLRFPTTYYSPHLFSLLKKLERLAFWLLKAMRIFP